MEMRHKPSETVRAYLLGALDEREASELEVNYFTDPACLRGVRSVEESLIEDYFKKRLSPADRQRFEIRYLEVPELKRRLEEVRSRLEGTASRTKSAVWPSIRLAVACLGLLAVGAGSWRYFHPRSPRTIAAARSAIPVPMAVITLRLIPGVAKGAVTKGRELTVPAAGAVVRMTLELPGRRMPLDCTVRLLALDADGRPGVVWTSQLVRSESVADVGEVTVEPDASILHPADYIVQVVTPQGGILETYVFRINRR
jgi:hypothetical protein